MIKIEVTQKDIDVATKGSYYCPIAKAVNRITGQYASVNGRSMFCYNYTDNQKGKRIWLDNEACKFVADFDAGKEVKPFIFEIDL